MLQDTVQTLLKCHSYITVIIHRTVFVCLQLQNQRLSKIESAAKDNSFLVEDLKFKEREYRKKISLLERAEQEKDALRMENSRLREEMQDR